MESMVFPRVIHLSLFHSIHQLWRIASYWNVCYCGSFTTQNKLLWKIHLKPYNQIFFKSLRYTGCLKMSKFKVNAKHLSRVFLNAFSLIETVIAIIGLSWTSPSHLILFPIVYFETVSLDVLFHLSKDSYRYHWYLSCCLYQFLPIQALSPFSSLMLYLPTCNTTCFVCNIL